MQYCVAANYYWLLVEGVYLYTLLAFSVFSEQRIFKLYLTIGWGKAHSHSPYNLHGDLQQGLEDPTLSYIWTCILLS